MVASNARLKTSCQESRTSEFEQINLTFVSELLTLSDTLLADLHVEMFAAVGSSRKCGAQPDGAIPGCSCAGISKHARRKGITANFSL